MDKKQWFVLGLALLIIPTIFLFTNLTSKDCSELNEMNALANVDAQLSSCYNQVTMIRNISTICWVLGFSFFICSVLEPKQKHKQ